jgi:hypothetical protein
MKYCIGGLGGNREEGKGRVQRVDGVGDRGLLQ